MFLQVRNRGAVQFRGAKEVSLKLVQKDTQGKHVNYTFTHIHTKRTILHVENPTIRSPLTNTMLSNFKTIQDTTTELIQLLQNYRVKLQRCRMCRLWLLSSLELYTSWDGIICQNEWGLKKLTKKVDFFSTKEVPSSLGFTSLTLMSLSLNRSESIISTHIHIKL